MEGYEFVKRLGSGAQGVVHLVKNKTNNRNYVMKKIECQDETNANKAFNEAMSLKDLQHPNICGYREFFVNWDKESDAMHVCIVMDHYPCGDLHKYMEIVRKAKKPINELIIKKWLGQIIDVLAFIHEKGVIHRDLKPKNIFLTERTADLVVGDFGVATVMGDARVKTRTAVGSPMWMAPEVNKRPYDARSDIWSVGVIFVQLLTCQALTEAELTNMLLQDTNTVLENLFTIISKTFSKDLVSVVRLMLRREFEQRSTSKELLKLPFVTQCIAATKPAKVNDTTQKPVPVDKGVPGVISYVKAEKQSESCVNAGLQWISQQDGLRLDNDAEKVVAEAMVQQVSSENVCRHGTKIFSILSEKARVKDAMFTTPVMKAIVGAVKGHARCLEIQLNFNVFLIHLATYESAAIPLGNVGSIQCVLDSMRTFPDVEDLIGSACHALWSLCTEEPNAKMAVSEGALSTVCTAIRSFGSSPSVLQHAASLVYPLIMGDEGIELAREENIVYMLLNSMKTFIGHTDLIKYSLLTISSLIEDEYIALTFVECQEGEPPNVLQGIPILKEIYEVHKDNVNVVRHIIDVTDILLRHRDIVNTVRKDVIKSFVKQIHNKYSNDEAKILITDDIKTAIVDKPQLRSFITEIHKRYRKDQRVNSACLSALESLEA